VKRQSISHWGCYEVPERLAQSLYEDPRAEYYRRKEPQASRVGPDHAWRWVEEQGIGE